MFHDDTDPDRCDRGLAVLEALSNGALDLIKHGRYIEAEQICRELEQRFPDQIDWLDRLAILHEARGEVDRAIERYEECLTHIDRYPDGIDSDCRAWYRDQIARLRSDRAR